ncbi:hypothetical protein V2E29_21395 [Streptomyces diastatochromogenes]|uniref:hypothetical protein n=1 Tax=Streptomyces diastatochromogenes TaxID=42236 RepID=UPI002F269153
MDQAPPHEQAASSPGGEHALTNFKSAVQKAESALDRYVADTHDDIATQLRDQLRKRTPVATDWIRQSYDDLRSIPFAELAKKGDAQEIQRRIKHQFDKYYDEFIFESGVKSLHMYWGGFSGQRRALLEETPGPKHQQTWKAACDAVDDVQKQFPVLYSSLKSLSASLKEVLDDIKDCANDANCLQQDPVEEWKRALEIARSINE